MKPVRFFTHQQTVWYNLTDYIQLLLDTQIIRPQRPPALYKRKQPAKSIETILFDKVNRLNPVYQRRLGGMVYVDWVVFEHLSRLIRPFLMHADDWANPESLFGQLQRIINRPRRSQQSLPLETLAAYFTELKDTPRVDNLQAEG